MDICKYKVAIIEVNENHSHNKPQKDLEIKKKLWGSRKVYAYQFIKHQYGHNASK